MIQQSIRIPKYDWYIDIMWNVRPYDADNVIDHLFAMGCARKHRIKAEKLLKSGEDNEGLTYTDQRHRRTLIVIGHASSIGEVISTIIHEVDHLTDHISQHYGIPYDSEENSYLIGNIVKTIFEDAVGNTIKILRHRDNS